MGLFGAYLWYRHGKKKATRRARRELDEFVEEANEVCDNCGYTAAQHSDEGYCPTYE